MFTLGTGFKYVLNNNVHKYFKNTKWYHYILSNNMIKYR